MIVADAADVSVTDDVGTAMDDGPGMDHGQVRQKEVCGKFLCQCTRPPMLLLWGECTECVGAVLWLVGRQQSGRAGLTLANRAA